MIHNQNRPHPATRVKPLVLEDTVSKYDGTMFLQPAIEPTYERVRTLQQQQEPLPPSPSQLLPPPPSQTGIQSRGVHPPPPAAPSSGTAYMSLYDRLAQANSIHQLTKTVIPPSKPIEARQGCLDTTKPRRKGSESVLNTSTAALATAEKQLAMPSTTTTRPGKADVLTGMQDECGS